MFLLLLLFPVNESLFIVFFCVFLPAAPLLDLFFVLVIHSSLGHLINCHVPHLLFFIAFS